MKRVGSLPRRLNMPVCIRSVTFTLRMRRGRRRTGCRRCPQYGPSVRFAAVSSTKDPSVGVSTGRRDVVPGGVVEAVGGPGRRLRLRRRIRVAEVLERQADDVVDQRGHQRRARRSCINWLVCTIQVERVADDLRHRSADVVGVVEILAAVLQVAGGVLHVRDREGVPVAGRVEDDDVHAFGESAQVLARRTVRLLGNLQLRGWLAASPH